jgi:hypothetical protein
MVRRDLPFSLLSDYSVKSNCKSSTLMLCLLSSAKFSEITDFEEALFEFLKLVKSKPPSDFSNIVSSKSLSNSENFLSRFDVNDLTEDVAASNTLNSV